MKKLVTLVIVASFTAPLFASGKHTMAGCGLGYVLFGHEKNDRLMQILAATTNGTSGNQTFGITSGTSGCTEDGAVKFVKEAEVFAEVNLDTLRQEMAAGQGEFVTAFATLLGANESNVPTMVKFFHDEYSSLFATPSTTSAELMASLQQKLSQRPDLLG
jgi:hypothetical protein